MRGTVIQINHNIEQGTLQDDSGVVWTFRRGDLGYWMGWSELQTGSAVTFDSEGKGKASHAINIELES